LQGVSAALVWTVGLAIVSDTVAKDQLGEAMGWVTLGIGIAIFAGPMLGGIVFARAGYYAVFGMTFGLVGLDIAMRLVMIEASVAKKYRVTDNTAESQPNGTEPKPSNPNDTTAEPEEVIPPRSKRKVPTLLILLRSPRLLSGLWGCMIVALLLTSFDSVLPLYVNSIFQWDSTGAGLIFLPICLPSFLEPLIGRLGDKIGVRWIVVGGFVSALPFFVLLRLVTYDSLSQKVLLCVLLFLLGLSVSLVMPPLMAEVTLIVSDREREEPGIFGDKSAFAQAYALFNMAYAAGTCLGPLWAGFVAQTAGWGTMAWTLGLLSAVTAVPMAVWTGGSALDIKRRKEDGRERERGERRPMSEADAEGDADSGNSEMSRNA
jgi:MFS family permease